MLIKRLIALAAAMILCAAVLPASAEENLNNYVTIEGTDTQHVLTYIEGTTPILEVDGLKFKDHNKNGTLEVYEDWRVDAETRTQDLISQMTVREKIAQRIYLQSQTRVQELLSLH